MKLIADENIEWGIVSRLRSEGFEVYYIPENEQGLDDVTILRLSRESSALLLTADKDFGELVFRQGEATAGVILVRLAGLSEKSKAEIVLKALQTYGKEMMGNFSVISHSQLRIRQGNVIRLYPRS